MKLTTLNRAASAILTVLLLILGIGVVYNAQSLSHVIEAYQKQRTYIQRGQQMVDASDYLTLQSRLFAVTQDLDHLENYWNEVRSVQRRKEAVEQLKAKGASQSELAYLERSKNNSDALVQTEARSMRLVLAALDVADTNVPAAVADVRLSEADQALSADAKIDQARQILFDDTYMAHKASITGPVSTFREEIEARAAGTVADARAAATMSLWLIAGLVVLLGLGIGGVLWILRGQITQPLEGFANQLSKDATNGQEDPINVSGAYEVEQVADSFNEKQRRVQTVLSDLEAEKASVEQKVEAAVRESESQKERLAEKVQELLGVMDQFAAGDLRVRVEAEGDDQLARLFDGFNRAATNLQTMLNEVHAAVASTNTAAEQISTASQQLATSTEEQSAQSDEVAAAVEQMNQTIAQNARSTQTAAEVAESSRMEAREGQTVVTETTTTINQMADVMTTSVSAVESLADSTEEIGQIVQTIDEIADQTNLLALNAAIEAARAGEHGKGFAVVADEVRELAERTAQATGEVAEMIHRVQTETDEAVAVIQEGRHHVDDSLESARRTGDALTSIVEATGRVQAQTDEIAAASEEQSATSEQIAQSVQSISRVAQESAAAVNQVWESASRLDMLTNELTERIRQFDLGDPATPAAGLARSERSGAPVPVSAVDAIQGDGQ
jgi:methyl-accepting chemotaxis protein